MNSGNELKEDINFLFEMGTIRYIDRMWRRFLNKDFANLAEHHFRMFWIAMVIASHEENVDTGKIAKMVMVHDIVESRTGDVEYITRQYVERKEELGIVDMLEGTSLKKDFFKIWQEYQLRETLESKIVKDADNLDVDLELAEQSVQGHNHQDLWSGIRAKNVKPILYTDTAKTMFDQIQVADPHDWHMQGRNRNNAGDWKKSDI